MITPLRVRFLYLTADLRLWDADEYVSVDGTARWFVGSDGVVSLACPYCGTIGQITTLGPGAWTWNGDMVRPTVSPSILVDTPSGGCGFHCFVRNGYIVDAGTPPHGETKP